MTDNFRFGVGCHFLCHWPMDLPPTWKKYGAAFGGWTDWTIALGAPVHARLGLIQSVCTRIHLIEERSERGGRSQVASYRISHHEDTDSLDNNRYLFYVIALFAPPPRKSRRRGGIASRGSDSLSGHKMRPLGREVTLFFLAVLVRY
jgi:hypothetical protein